MTRVRLYEHVQAISVATFGRRFIRKCVAPIRILPKDARLSRGARASSAGSHETLHRSSVLVFPSRDCRPGPVVHRDLSGREHAVVQ
jgi:hypothetical protein